MPIHASPGVYFETIDFSVYTPKLTSTILGMVGKTSKGPTEPTFVTSIRQFIDLFGTPRKGDYSALAAVSYLEFGSSLWFSRLVGPNAKKASVEIPKANQITDELLATVDNTGKYIFNATLNNAPVAGTVEIKIADPNDSSNFVVIKDDGNGNFSAITNSSITQYPNFIDYDTGEFRFTLSSVNPGDEVAIRYNHVEHTVSGETVITTESGTYTYDGILAHANIVDTANFELIGSDGSHTYTFTVSGMVDSTTYNLAGEDELGNSVGSGTLNTATGVFQITMPSQINTIFTANYKYSTFKIKTLGTVGQVNADGILVDTAFVGNLNTTVIPNSVSILVNSSEVSSDNGEGKFVSGIVTCDNSIDYTTGDIEFALVTPPEEGFKITATYLSKYTQVLDTIGAGGSTGGSVSGVLTETPVIKESVVVKLGSDYTLLDDGEGNLVGTGGNGTVDYATGEISINYVVSLNEGDTIEVVYLARYGTATALYEGEAYNNIRLEFFKDEFSGYGLKIWNPNQLTTQVPEEIFNNITFGDESETTFITNKVVSRQVELTIDDTTSGDIPLFGTVLTLTGGDSDEENVTVTSATAALDVFGNAEQYDINLLACPDYPGDKTVANKLIEICEAVRGDCFAIIDPPQNLTVQQVVDWHNGAGQWSNDNALASSFAALYYPWLQISDQFTGSLQWVPPSVRMVSVFAYNDRVAEVWNAPAGLNRGRIFNVQRVERSLSAADRDLLYATGTNAVNPICDFVGDGIVVFGQKTLQRKPSALDRVNVMRLIIYITKVLATATKYLLFEPNDKLTWTLYEQMVNPLLAEIKHRRGLYEFRIVCDETTNTPYNIDNGVMVAEVWLKPTKAAERLINRFVITSTGASFSELIAAQQ
jgi:phage tail sheath protein FI